jgi:uncharacterized surface protein with fasciclin (FAS1) repeats
MRKQRIMLVLMVGLLLVGTGFTSALGQAANGSATEAVYALTGLVSNGLTFADNNIVPDEIGAPPVSGSEATDDPSPADNDSATTEDGSPTANNGSPAMEGEAAAAAARPTDTVLGVLQAQAQLSDFATLVAAAGLADNLDRDGPFTVFAPTNAAMSILGTPVVSQKTAATRTEILLYHVVNGRYLGPEIAELDLLPTLMGGYLAVAVIDGQIVLNDEVVVTIIDIPARNGIVHIVDAVLLPPVNSLLISDKGSREHTLSEVLAADGRFTTFLTLLDMAGLTVDLDNLSHTYTLFAPTDSAFTQLPEEEYEKLFHDQQHRETILAYHLVGDTLGINQIAHARFIPTVEGRPLRIMTDDQIRVYINSQPLESFNIIAANGVIHVVESVLLP